ncbi:MAG: carboxyl-terminal processing protease [Parcubacteria bacterium C7867-007]|nr:MAG: carboxyl-terminal processing protease [Parcubacteria bacterium C7867-007]
MDEVPFTEDESAFDAAPAPQKKYTRTVRNVLIILLVLALGFAAGLTVGSTGGTRVFSNIPLIGDGLSATPDESIDFTDFWKVYNVLNARFVETHATSTPPTKQEIVWGAIQGLTTAYGDPYTTFFPPEESKIFEDDIAGNFDGIGAEIGLSKEGVLTIIAPLKESPAERAGLRPGDLIIEINGNSTENISVEEAVQQIRGKKGTTVTFTIYRDEGTLEIPVVRDVINVPTIDTEYDAKTGIYTIALYTFTANSADLFEGALADMRKNGAKKLIIDLRGNPGGYLDAAVAIGSHFLPSGTPIVTEDYKGKEENIVHKSSGSGGVPAGIQVVILQDQGSASASEILAGALQDAKVATIVGTHSFGKGSVQELVKIGKGSLKVTIARWLTPSGRSISNGGVLPDIKVERTFEDFKADKDPQMDRAILFLNTGS